MSDMVNHPTHYTQYKHEVIELASCCGFCLGNAIKYVLRSDFKGRRAEDLRKAAWYVNYINGMELNDIKKQVDPYALTKEEFVNLVKSYKNPVVSRLVYACAKGNQDAIADVHEGLLILAEEAEE